MKVIKKFVLIILMITIFLIIAETKVQATTENIQENSDYSLQSEIQLRILPLMNSTRIGNISGNVRVTEIINDWCKIENEQQQGWIRVNAVKTAIFGNTENVEEDPVENEIPVEEQPTVQPENEVPETDATDVEEQQPEKEEEKVVELNKIGYVDADGLVVRKEPNTSSEELHSLSRNDKVQITGQIGKWYRINYDGEVAYVSAKYISDEKTTSRGEISREESTENKIEEKVEEQPKDETNEEPKQENSSNLGQQIVDYAKQYLGYKYVSGGASPTTGFDCSGFTQYVYKNFGITLNRTSAAQNSNGVAVSKSNLQVGDLLIFNGESNKSIGHVGIYIGDGQFIHASNPKGGVKITELSVSYYASRYVGARRVI